MVCGRGVGTSSPAASDRATSAASFLPARSRLPPILPLLNHAVALWHGLSLCCLLLASTATMRHLFMHSLVRP